MDLMECPLAMHPPYAKTMVERYLPLMHAQFGSDDEDVDKIRQRLVLERPATKQGFCDGCKRTHGGKVQACSRCFLAFYCSKDCQGSS